MAIRNLATHGELFVTLGELAAYWRVSSRLAADTIRTVAPNALAFGRHRIPVEAARRFEQQIARRPKARESIRRYPLHLVPRKSCTG